MFSPNAPSSPPSPPSAVASVAGVDLAEFDPSATVEEVAAAGANDSDVAGFVSAGDEPNENAGCKGGLDDPKSGVLDEFDVALADAEPKKLDVVVVDGLPKDDPPKMLDDVEEDPSTGLDVSEKKLVGAGAVSPTGFPSPAGGAKKLVEEDEPKDEVVGLLVPNVNAGLLEEVPKNELVGGVNADSPFVAVLSFSFSASNGLDPNELEGSAGGLNSNPEELVLLVTGGLNSGNVGALVADGGLNSGNSAFVVVVDGAVTLGIGAVNGFPPKPAKVVGAGGGATLGTDAVLAAVVLPLVLVSFPFILSSSICISLLLVLYFSKIPLKSANASSSMLFLTVSDKETFKPRSFL